MKDIREDLLIKVDTIEAEAQVQMEDAVDALRCADRYRVSPAGGIGRRRSYPKILEMFNVEIRSHLTNTCKSNRKILGGT